jgi:hypothetical protein
MIVLSTSSPRNLACTYSAPLPRFYGFFLCLLVCFALFSGPTSHPQVFAQESQIQEKKDPWKALFVPELREKWNATNFGGEGKVEWKESEVLLEIGFPMTGLNFTGEFPKEGFEIEMEANRLEGSDFLCGLTFPVGKGFCSYIGGGWGGTLVGLSCVDYNDAANNSTTQFFNFENKKWYKFRVRVDAQNITCWIDDKEIVKQAREGHEFQVRSEVNASRPFGVAVYQSRVAIRNLKYRVLEAAEAVGQ